MSKEFILGEKPRKIIVTWRPAVGDWWVFNEAYVLPVIGKNWPAKREAFSLALRPYLHWLDGSEIE